MQQHVLKTTTCITFALKPREGTWTIWMVSIYTRVVLMIVQYHREQKQNGQNSRFEGHSYW